MSNTRYMEPMIQHLFDLINQGAPKDEQQAKQIADEAIEYIKAIQQLEQIEQSKNIVYEKLNKKIKFINNVNLEVNDQHGRTLLTCASYHDHVPIARALLAAKVDPNKKGENGYTPLNMAAVLGHVSTIQILLEAKADINNEAEKDMLPLPVAIIQGHEKAVQALLIAKADPNRACGIYDTPLLCAVLKKHIQIVQLLLAAKACPDKDRLGVTPLTWAAKENYTQIVVTLLEAKADPNKMDKMNKMPLCSAIDSRQVQMVTILLDAKADVNKVNEMTGETALTCAVKYRNFEIISLLLSEKAAITHPITFFDFLMPTDPRVPDFLYCLNALSEQQHHLRELNLPGPELLSDEQYQAMEQYRYQLAKVGGRFSREALNPAIGNILIPPLINIIGQYDAPLHRLNNPPTFFDKRQVEAFRIGVAEQYKKFYP